MLDGEKVEMLLTKRRFMMGNALVVNLIKQMEPLLDETISGEPEIEMQYNIADIVKLEHVEV